MPDAPTVPAVATFDADALFARALLRGTFTLRSGATSDRYFDKYRVTCEPSLLGPVVDELHGHLVRAAPHAGCIVAPELGAVPLAAPLSLRAGIPFVIVRGVAKSYATGARIEGPVPQDAVAVIVEDVVTSGGAALEALDAAEAGGLHVRHALCLLDRDGGGREALAARGVELHALLHAHDLDAAVAAGLGIEVSS